MCAVLWFVYNDLCYEDSVISKQRQAKNLKEAIIGLIGVAVGALIGLFATYLQNKNNIKLFIMQRRIDAYKPVIELYLKSTTNSEEITFSNVVDEFQHLSSDVLLYGSNRVKNQLEKVKNLVLNTRISKVRSELHSGDSFHEIREFVKLVELMRSDLKIK